MAKAKKKTLVPAVAAASNIVKVRSNSADPIVDGVTITHPQRILWADGGVTKLELARYYAAVAPRLLAQAGDRPISLVRCPQGPGKQCFFQRHAGESMSDAVHGVRVAGHGDGKPYIYIDDARGLLSLVQMGTIELHAWNARVSDVKHPDRVIFDLDPAPDVAWDEVRRAAQDLRDGLEKLKLIAYLKTTGGKGLHVVVPFTPGPTWAQVKSFARAFCEVYATTEPRRFTINNRKEQRVGRIFLDYLRNDETASAVAAYSVRSRPGAPVSVPIEWSELPSLESGDVFKMRDVIRRRKDPWRHMERTGRKQVLPLESTPGPTSSRKRRTVSP